MFSVVDVPTEVRRNVRTSSRQAEIQTKKEVGPQLWVRKDPILRYRRTVQ